MLCLGSRLRAPEFGPGTDNRVLKAIEVHRTKLVLPVFREQYPVTTEQCLEGERHASRARRLDETEASFDLTRAFCSWPARHPTLIASGLSSFLKAHCLSNRPQTASQKECAGLVATDASTCLSCRVFAQIQFISPSVFGYAVAKIRQRGHRRRKQTAGGRLDHDCGSISAPVHGGG